jgi:predicted RNA-binding Zn-ribbon protein involved in translation (DUF1610 family)
MSVQAWCDTCRRDTIQLPDLNGSGAYFCPRCGSASVVRSTPLNATENASAPRRAHGGTEHEETVQQGIVIELRSRGYIVLVTSEHRRAQKCRHCGTLQYLAGGRGCTAGVPDLLVTRQEWPANTWRGLEVKSATGRTTPAQKELTDAGRIAIVRSVEEALCALERGCQEWTPELAYATGMRDLNGKAE